MEGSRPTSQADVVLGEDWIGKDAAAESQARAKRDRRGVIAMNRSPLARKIITFNLLAILVLVTGVLFLNPFRDSLVYQRERAMVTEAELISGFFENLAWGDLPGDVFIGEQRPAERILAGMALPRTSEVFIYDGTGSLVASTIDRARAPSALDAMATDDRSTMISDFLDALWGGVATVFGKGRNTDPAPQKDDGLVVDLIPQVLARGTQVRSSTDLQGNTIFTVAAPIMSGDKAMGAVAISSAAGEIDNLVRTEREQILQMFVIAILVSVGLSLVLASTIANPLSDLAAAAEIGREKNARKFSPSRVRIPDLTARPDEIGRLSGALRGMVAALYDRIDANEQLSLIHI